MYIFTFHTRPGGAGRGRAFSFIITFLCPPFEFVKQILRKLEMQESHVCSNFAPKITFVYVSALPTELPITDRSLSKICGINFHFATFFFTSDELLNLAPQAQWLISISKNEEILRYSALFPPREKNSCCQIFGIFQWCQLPDSSDFFHDLRWWFSTLLHQTGGE